MTIQSGVLTVALLCMAVGILLDVVISEKVKGPGRGWFRPQAWRGFSTGLPCYLLGAFLLSRRGGRAVTRASRGTSGSAPHRRMTGHAAPFRPA
jgi:hypothetical protein